METKHTPGPWKVSESGQDVRDFIVIEPTGNTIAEPCACLFADPSEFDKSVRKISFEEARANARLIAAAPELLEALKALEEQVADLRAGRTWDADYVGLKQAHLRAKVAIQKAEA